eukprot:sb/3469555/
MRTSLIRASVFSIGAHHVPHTGEPPAIDNSGTKDNKGVVEEDDDNDGKGKDETHPANLSKRRKFDRSLRICKFFRTNRCKFGNNGKGCKFYHPPVCRKYKEWGTDEQRGCSKDSECNYFHVKLCKSGGPDRKCKKTKCHLVHVRTRKNNPPPPPDNRIPPAKTNQVSYKGPRAQQNFLTLVEQLTAAMAALSHAPKKKGRNVNAQNQSCCAQKAAATITHSCLNSCC